MSILPSFPDGPPLCPIQPHQFDLCLRLADWRLLLIVVVEGDSSSFVSVGELQQIKGSRRRKLNGGSAIGASFSLVTSERSPRCRLGTSARWSARAAVGVEAEAARWWHGCSSQVQQPAFAPARRARLGQGAQQADPACSVQGCMPDLSRCCDYHRRHKVCEAHSKRPVLAIAGMQCCR